MDALCFDGLLCSLNIYSCYVPGMNPQSCQIGFSFNLMKTCRFYEMRILSKESELNVIKHLYLT